MAVGGDQVRILTSLVAHSLVLVLLGVGIGVGGSMLFERWLSSLVAELTIDGSHAALAAVVLGVTALAASYVPARKVLRIDPGSVLRAE